MSRCAASSTGVHRAQGRAAHADLERIVADVLDAIDPTVPFDAVDAISAPVPILMIAHMLGVPAEDLPTFRTWSDAIAIAATDPTDPRAMAAIDFFAYFNAKLDARAVEPDPPEDLLTAITADAELTRAEQLGFCMSLLVAGNETTRHLISGGLVALAEHPEQRATLAERRIADSRRRRGDAALDHPDRRDGAHHHLPGDPRRHRCRRGLSTW